MSEFIKENDLLITGDRPDAQQYGIDANVGCIVVCHNAPIEDKIIRQAEEKQIVIIQTPYDTFTVARQINQSIPVRHFTVSYTHLDVYKRQITGHMIFL